MRYILFIFLFLESLICLAKQKSVLIEAEHFDYTGGWVVDQQFIPTMGSPYLLAHGLGVPVDNATTVVTFPKKGIYYYWVRTKDWVPSQPSHPGRFKIIINGKEQETVFGINEQGWAWVPGGTVKIDNKSVKLELEDLTGLEGRCDAIYFSTDKADVPPNDLEKMKAWRDKKLGLTKPTSAGTFDLVVVGGGISGCCAAVAAAQQGLSVALINDRPVLGGNASKEVRVHTEGTPLYTIVDELNTQSYPNGDAQAILANDTINRVVMNTENISLYLNTYINGVRKSGDRITEVVGMNTLTSEKISFAGSLFVDATGDGWVGYYAGARYMMGREPQDEFNESLAPVTADSMTQGSTVLWNTYDSGKPSPFPAVPWAMDVAKDYNVASGEWYWEYGMNLNTIYDAEEIRDHLFRAIYGTWHNMKLKPENAYLKLNWMAYIAGKRESRRLLGQYILTEQDVENHVHFDDGFVEEKRDIDIHSPKKGPYDFLSVVKYKKVEPYTIPYRCFVSKDISNLFMAGRCLSATHVGLGSPRVMNTCGQMGVVVGSAASVCTKYNCSPFQVYTEHLEELKMILDKLKMDNPDRAAQIHTSS